MPVLKHLIKNILTVSIVSMNLLGSSVASESQVADLYISPSGSDTWSGKLAEPNSKKTDGPFATLERARNAVRELKKNKKDITVLVRGGSYTLEKTTVFSLEDSGAEDQSITYAAYPNERPVFSSGKEIKGLKKLNSSLARLPRSAHGKVLVADVSEHFLTLYDDQGILPRARSKGFITPEDGGKNSFHFPKDLIKNWPNLTDAEVVVRPHHAWIVNILRLKSVDEKKQIAYTSGKASYGINALHFLKTTPNCWVENVLEELDEPGEWVLDTHEKKLYLWPRAKSAIVAPSLKEYIRVEGKVDFDGAEDIPVTNLHFKGLTFKHGERYSLKENDAGLQHDWDMLDKGNALVRFRGTENCSIDSCHFLHSGSGAIRVDLHGVENKIVNNKIEYMGGGGILLSGYGPGTKDVNRKNLVSNNHIHHVGKIYWHSPGIFIWQSGENRVSNNLIHNTPYTSLIVSGFMEQFFSRGGRELTPTVRWHEIPFEKGSNISHKESQPYLHTHDNIIEYNEIHHAMEKLGDGNAIYIRGAGANNIIRRNYIHHLVTPMIMQCAIRTDGGQRDTLIAENLIYKCTSQGIMMKLNTHVENNIVADVIAPPRGYYLSVREGPLTGATIKRNIFYSSGEITDFINELAPRNKVKTEDRRGRKLARSKDADADYNIYFSKSNPSQGMEFLKKQRSDGVDLHSRSTDPLFIAPEKGDFRFQPNSPAIKMGIKPIDISKIGLLKK